MISKAIKGALIRGQAVDRTAPLITSPSMASLTYQGGVPTFTTDTAEGTAYYAVYTGSAPSVAQVKAGTGGNIVSGKAGNKTVTASGVNTFSAVTGLDEATVYGVAYVHTDVAGNDSDLSTAAFTTQGMSQFVIYPHYIDVSATNNVPYYSNHVNVTDATRGLTFDFRRVSIPLGGYIRAISNCFESEMRPGCVLSGTPDAVDGTATTYDDSNVRYQKISFVNTDTTRLRKNIPTWLTEECDKAIVFGFGGAANFKLWRDRGGVITEIVASTTDVSSLASPKTVTLSPTVTGGDVLLWGQAGFGSGGGGDAYLAHIQIYNSTGSCTDSKTQHFIPVTQTSRTSVWMPNSTAEGAWRAAREGQSPVFTGGAAHQGGGYGQEYPFTETWTKAGEAWTPAAGCWTDRIVLSRSSTVYIDATYTDIGQIDTTYIFDPKGLIVAPSKFTAHGSVDMAQAYFGMLPVTSAAWAFTGLTVAGVDAEAEEEFSKATVTGGYQYFTGANATAAAATTYMRETPGGKSMCLYNRAETGSTINSRDTEPKGTDSVKNYMQLDPDLGDAAMTDGQSIEGSLVFFHAGAAGAMAADIAAVESALDLAA